MSAAPSTVPGPYAAVRERWHAAWPDALAAWGRFTRLGAPTLHGPGTAPRDVGSFAWFSTTRVSVHVDLAEVVDLGIEDHAVAVLAHEVGHHVLSPGDLTTSALLVARARAGLVDQDHIAPLTANLWSDLLINDRLQRRAGIDMAGLWRALGPGTSVVMQTVLRADEILWGLPRGDLTSGDIAVAEREATLVARLVRAYADDPVGGAAGFAALLRTLLASDVGADATSADARRRARPARGDRGARRRHLQRRRSSLPQVVCGQDELPGSVPGGLATDPRAVEPVRHPALDPRVVGDLGADGTDDADVRTVDAAATGAGASDATGQTLAPADYDATLRLLGLTSDAAASARRWYREHAAPLLVPFPVRTERRAVEPLLGAHEPWDVGDDLGDVDWTGTLLRSPVVVPGHTTVRRSVEDDTGDEPDEIPVDLDLYLDSSGSMPDPTRRVAPVALAGAVLALSALRAGARVQATTWSGPDQIAGTDGFTRDEDAVLDAVVAHFGGSTSFPLPLLERTHLGDPRTGAGPTRTRACHVAVVSDDGVETMFDDAVRLRWGRRTDAEPVPLHESVAARAVVAAGGGGTLVLDATDAHAERVRGFALGYRVHAVRTQDDLVAFARAFARELWGAEPSGPEGARHGR
ncbi:hypothetical protein [Cellulosimicrobium marinum]|uniref:hypothetical protein n=1 Tax=Cellulosimicrobium marinum TaxID=1638992 RepID=UPI001E43299A|nr:hypothetical protein [Cellulosimicrobium marinum]MCB7136320.1 hypothetical protein [Cellulosimicrobium marinum]